MKTLKLFFFIVFAFTITANAQITKGNWMVGGDASFFTNKSESENNGNNYSSETSYIMISPNIGYFVADKLVGGIGLQFSFVDPGKTFNSQSYSFGPYVRYYFLKPENLINVFSQVDYTFGFGKNGLDQKDDSNGYGLKAGTVIFFNSSVGLEFSLNYRNSKVKYDDGDNGSTKQFLVGVGLQIHLEK